MPIVPQEWVDTGSGTSNDTVVWTYATAPASGQLLLVGIEIDNSATVGILTANGWQQDVAVGANGHAAWILSKIAGASESATQTFTLNQSRNWRLVATRCTGNVTTGCFDKSASINSGASATTTRSTGTTATTAQADELAFALFGAQTEVTTWSSVTNSFAIARSRAQAMVATKTLSAVGTAETTATYSPSAKVHGLIGTYKASAAAGPSTGTATGSWTFTGTASGTAPAVPPSEGSATGSWSFVGTATGEATHQGTASGAWAFAGSATGETTHTGTASGSWAYAGTASGTAPTAGLATPTGLTATAVSTSQIDLSWNAVDTATGYDIERDSVVVVTDHPTTTYSDSGLSEFTEFSYRVRAVR